MGRKSFLSIDGKTRMDETGNWSFREVGTQHLLTEL
jgi:hypothetical protein